MSKGDVLLRRGGPADALAAAELWLRSRRASVGANPPPVHSDDEVRDGFATHLMEACEPWLAVAAAGRASAPLGLLVLDADWVDQLHVDPEWTGRGIGARLIALAQRERPDGLQLWTVQANRGARRFYEHHGFVAVELTGGSGNEERAPDVRYVWPAR
jgi:GNAT superfamily N-acetyltransferase